MVRAVDDFVVDSFRSVTRSFLFLVFFFRYINDLELLLNDLQNRLYMAKVKRKMVYSTQNNANSSLCRFIIFPQLFGNKKNLSDVGPCKNWAICTQKFHLCRFLQKNSSLHSKILQLSVLFSPSARKKGLKSLFFDRGTEKKSTSSTKHTRHYNDTPYIKLRRAAF